MYDQCPNCPVHPGVSAKLVATHQEQSLSSWHMEHLSMASHTGTHLDAPLHKIKGGKAIDDFPLSAFVGPARIVDLRGIAARTAITAAMLAEQLTGDLAGTIVLLATGWGAKRAATQEWHFDSPYLSEEGARWLVERGIKMVGIDHYSIGGSREPENAVTHTVLLSAASPVLIVEDLFFPERVFALKQPVEFMALPVNFRGFSGSFCRPVLLVA